MGGVFEHTATGRVLTVLQAGWQKEAEVCGVTSLLKVLGASIQYIPSWLASCVFPYRSQTRPQELLILLNNTERY